MKRVRSPHSIPWRFSGGGPRTPHQLLAVHWRRLDVSELTMYLKRLLTREWQSRPRKINPTEPPWHGHLQPRLRRRRMEVSARLLTVGIPISQRATAWSLPPWYRWPGSMYLVGKRCDEDLGPGWRAAPSIGGRSVKHQPRNADSHPSSAAGPLLRAGAR